MSLLNWLRSPQNDRNFLEDDVLLKLYGHSDAKRLPWGSDLGMGRSYDGNIDVYMCIRKLVETMLPHPWIVEQKLSNGKWKELSGTSIHELIDNPNATKMYNWNDIIEMITVYLTAAGNAFVYGETILEDSMIMEIDILPSQNVTIQSNRDFFLPDVTYNFTSGITRRQLTNENVCHIKYFDPRGYFNGQMGLSPIRVAEMAVQAGNDFWEARAVTFQNKGANGLITDKSNQPMTPTEALEAQKRLDERIAGPKKFNKTIITNKDLNFIQLAMSPQDLQLIESGVVTSRAICNVFNLDSSLFNDPGNKTYANRTEAEKALYTNAVIPLSTRISNFLTYFLCKNHFPTKTVRLRQDFSKVECLQDDLAEKNDILIKQKANGVITANEFRAEFNREASSDENADKLIISATSQLQGALTESSPQGEQSQAQEPVP